MVMTAKTSELQRSLVALRDGKKEDFLNAFQAHGKVTRACLMVDTPVSTIYQWLKDDPVFLERYVAVKWARGEHLIEIAEEKGEKGSDVLLMFTIKGLRNEYREAYQATTVTTNILLYDSLHEVKDYSALEHAPAHLLALAGPSASGSEGPPPSPGAGVGSGDTDRTTQGEGGEKTGGK